MRQRHKRIARGLLAGGALGAGLMYYLDPDTGRRRLGRVRDKASWLVHRSDDAIFKTAHDMANRSRGLGAEIAGLFKSGEAGDDVLEARVRSRLGRLVSHPHAIEVHCAGGYCTLKGAVLEAELDQLLEGVRSVRGVHNVVNLLKAYKQADDVSTLQGGAGRPQPRSELMQDNWSPTTRTLMGAAGIALTTWGLRKRNVMGTLAGAAGFGFLARAVSNLDFERLFGFNRSRRGIEIHKTLNVHAPLDQVFRLWTDIKNFPKFMPHIREVRQLGDGRTHWVAHVAPGLNVEWTAEATRLELNQQLAWRSESGALVPNAGIIHFTANPDGSTRVDMRISYNPPAGALGHAIARAFGADLKSRLDEDLVRFKSLLETGKATVHGEQIRRDQLAS